MTGLAGGSRTDGPCSIRHTGPDRPATDATPLVSVTGISAWSPPWVSTATPALYPDGTVAMLADGDATSAATSSVPSPTSGEPASDTDPRGETANDPTPTSRTGLSGRADDGSLRPALGGRIDPCTFDHLTSQLDDLLHADYGRPQVFDVGSTVLRIATGDQRTPVEVVVDSFGAAGTDTGLTAAQQRARRVLADWIRELDGAVAETGALPDRVRITSTGPTPWGGVGASRPVPAQTPVAWEGAAMPTSCTVVTGARAREALANMHRALDARASSTDGPPVAWGVFRAPAGDGPVYLGMQQVLPGEGCR